jgi:hypothetical protein
LPWGGHLKGVAKIDINTADAKQLTQLPGIGKNVAYNIVNHRARHGWYTRWEELKEVKEFPAARLREIASAAILSCPDEDCSGPRHLRPHLAEERKKPSGYTRAIRSTRGADKLKRA